MLKHQNIIKRLDHLQDNNIIEYFKYENMKDKEHKFCTLYKNNTKCHDMENLNCYLCACPHFRVTSSKSYCAIDSKDGGFVKDKNGFIHQDCSNCTIPHEDIFIKNNFSKNWALVMKDVI
ncbi:FIG00388424: hypothetical protein [hydrothermal vent metagenome]|uniref:Uncharacterized protein n=1 Tax=hydrothermal vent metagenome TaxID=652676 RepID=A0A3B1E5H5_9ZZZZ